MGIPDGGNADCCRCDELQAEIEILRHQMAELRLVMAAIHPEFFVPDHAPPTRTSPTRPLRVIRSAVALAIAVPLMHLLPVTVYHPRRRVDVDAVRLHHMKRPFARLDNEADELQAV